MKIKVSGKNVFINDQGAAYDPDKPTLVFIHGAGQDSSVWTMQARWAAFNGYNAIAANLPGHGRTPARLSSGKPLTTIEKMADWVVKLVKTLDPQDKLVIVGHSMGALIGAEALFRLQDNHGERLSGVLIGAATRMPVHPDLLDAAANNRPFAHELISDWGFAETGHIGGHKVPGFWSMDAGRALMEGAGEGVLATGLAACNDYEQDPTHISTVHCPVQIIAGRLDRMTPAKQGMKLASLYPNANCRILEDTGHMIMAEKPDETLLTIQEFLKNT